MKLDRGAEESSTYRFEPSISPPRYSATVDYRTAASFTSRASSVDSRMSPTPFVDNGSTTSSTSRIHIVLSTPSPSARANGEKVDREVGKLTRLKEDWKRHREIVNEEPFYKEDSTLNGYAHSERSSSSPGRTARRLYCKRASRSRSASPNKDQPCPIHYPGARRSLSRERQYIRQLREKTPLRKTPPRDNRSSPDNRSSRASSIENSYNRIYPEQNNRHSPPVGSKTYRRSSSYDDYNSIEVRSRSSSPADRFKRSISHSDSEHNYILRALSRSPEHYSSLGHSAKLNFVSNFFNPRKSLSAETVSLLRNIFNRSISGDFDDTASIKSTVSLTRDLFKRGSIYSTLPRSSKHRRPSIQSDTFEDRENSDTYSTRSSPPRHIRGVKTYSTYSNPKEVIYEKESNQNNNKMSSSPRKLSDESSRRPLATLHEDKTSYRRYSNDKKSFESLLDDYYNEQRRLSEAGVRKLSGIDPSIRLNDEDGFYIGDVVWVGGTKRGKISFIGETKFGSGEWAGVTLEDPIGKNDGSVSGIRYFQCEPRKGVFSRLSRLSRQPLAGYTDLDFLMGNSTSLFDSPKKNDYSYSPARKTSPSYDGIRRVSASPTRSGVSPSPNRSRVSPSPTRSYEINRKTTPPRSQRNGTPSRDFRRGSSPLATHTELNIGDSVVIAGTTGLKYGVLRFLGKTEFADGLWGGIELDEPTGKNDGTMAGRKYGLFAPVSRISKFGRSSTPPRRSITPTRTIGTKSSLSSLTAPTFSITQRYATTNSDAVKNLDDEDGFY